MISKRDTRIAEQARRQALEEAATVCEDRALKSRYLNCDHAEGWLTFAARDLRAMIEEPKEAGDE